MRLNVEGRVTAVELWKYTPGTYKRTKPKRLESPALISEVQRILGHGLVPLEFCAEPPDNPRYIVKLHYQRRKPIAVKVNGTIVMTADRCYYTRTPRLWTLLEKNVSRQIETEEAPAGKPCFVRVRERSR
jgi:hypothetical protein